MVSIHGCYFAHEPSTGALLEGTDEPIYKPATKRQILNYYKWYR
jgi:elongation factor P hydroxylase